MNKKFSTVALCLICFVLVADNVDLSVLFNYANQAIPNYISKDNTPNNNQINDEEATLGRILFYDKNLSANNTVSCSSCHKQEFAFGDTSIQSIGLNGGLTGRHSTRLVNARFGDEEKFFWDERANTLEIQTTMPIQDHIEMGFSGTNGDPSLDSLLVKLQNISYYNELFEFVYGDITVTEERIQRALAQFIRSMQSFDSRYDAGRAQVNNNNAPFPNFTAQENLGKTLFMQNANNGGANCNTCHRAPEFDIDPNSDNNGIIGVAGMPGTIDITNTRSPNMRDLVNNNGESNGPFMHDGSLATLMDVVNHYDNIPTGNGNTNLDNRLMGPGGNGQNLNLTQNEKDALVAFMLTLTGTEIYVNEKWSDPFDANGNITIINNPLPITLELFESEQQENLVLLKWITSSEVNNDGFEILHKSSDREWQPIGFVNGMGNSVDIEEYEFIHTAPSEGINYYQLRQLDFDGAESFSEIISENISLENIEIKIYPNPTSDYFVIANSKELQIVNIYNSQGQLLTQKMNSPGDEINVSELTAGRYIIETIGNESKERKATQLIKL